MKRILVFFMVAVMLLATVGCNGGSDVASDGQDGSSSESDKMTFAWLSNKDTDASNVYMGLQFEKQAEELGFELIRYDAQNEVEKQVSQINEAISLGVDGIFINPVDKKALVSACMNAQDKVIVATVSGDIADEKYRHFFVGPDDYEAGTLAAAAMIEHFADGANVVMVEGGAGHNAAIRRKEGFEEGIEGSKINLLGTQATEWDPAKAMSVTEDFITKYGDQIDAIYSHWDHGSVSIVEALKAKNMNDVYIISVDGNRVGFELVREGKIYGTVYQDMPEIIKVSCETMIDVVNGTTADKTIHVPLKLKTADNIGDLDPGW